MPSQESSGRVGELVAVRLRLKTDEKVGAELDDLELDDLVRQRAGPGQSCMLAKAQLPLWYSGSQVAIS